MVAQFIITQLAIWLEMFIFSVFKTGGEGDGYGIAMTMY